MERNIAIVAGGDSSEIVISLKSAEGIYSFIDKEKYNLYIAIVKKGEWAVQLPNGEHTPIDKNDFSFRENGKVKHFDFAYITIHGTPGEDGRLQGYFDMIGLPYSSCGMLVSAITFNKFVCSKFLHNFGVKIAKSIRLFKGQSITNEDAIAQLGLPIFVKPNDGGSSFGVTKVKEASALQPAIERAFIEGKEVLLESFISGTEVTCGCYKVGNFGQQRKEVVFPITEVVTKNEFFDFNAKYNGQVQEITPARISPELTEKIQSETSRIYDLLGAKGLIRIDYIIPADGEPYLLEINTTPGMTATSFIPQQVRAAGLDIKDVMTDIIENEF
ncbi:D-alanine--D-alanine ligase [Parabacteroides bouchesdurhonensis]|uniref:D-alanine--D-alanine ligase n=1 Tax=Parabacteroides bouchesdurhonensis TaxID=1936995 RepID=UPI000E552C55|nr:D-alanine--D-alanine ligase [Parabacteroides bouchesdurhonensis]RHJ92964.1 D-alanine--D-alanine ligase [Bacteroides sp. AM07-16]